MFIKHFDLDEHPFMESPPLSWLIGDGRVKEPLARLSSLAHQGNLALIIGQTGLGKSSLLRLFSQNLPKSRDRTVYIHLTSVSPNAFLRTIAKKLGESPRLGKDRLFDQFVEGLAKYDATTYLMVDEGHLLAIQTLTDIRLLVTHGIDSSLPLKVILCGQEGLRQTLKSAALADLANRVSVSIHLKALSRSQTTQYIEHRVQMAGGSEGLFDPDAMHLIHDYAGGIPRQINNIGTACMLTAYREGKSWVSEEIVNITMRDFRLL